MNKYKLVMFDLDGTLTDSGPGIVKSPGILNSIRYTQKMMELPEITEEQMRSHVGPPMEESYNRNFGLTGDDLKKAVMYHKEYAVMKGYKEIELYQGIKQLFDMLKAKDIKIAVATLKAHVTAIKIFDSLEMTDVFDYIIGTDVKDPKTKAELLMDCISNMGCRKEECVLVGDSKYDAIGAQEAGIDFIAVTYGFGFAKAENIEYPCVKVADNTTDIYNYICDDD